MPRVSTPLRIVLVLVLWALLRVGPAIAQTPPPPGNVGLDRLLKIPETLDFDVEKRGGLTRNEWLSRFEEARGSVVAAREGLAQAQDRLSAAAGRKDNWNMAPPGLPVEAAEGGGDTHRLREDVRRWRAEIERSERRLRDLEVQASLAGVPESWRGQGTDPLSENDSVTRAPAAR